MYNLKFPEFDAVCDVYVRLRAAIVFNNISFSRGFYQLPLTITGYTKIIVGSVLNWMQVKFGAIIGPRSKSEIYDNFQMQWIIGIHDVATKIIAVIWADFIN